MNIRTYPALNIIGGRRYIKKNSSLNSKILEFFPPELSKITAPVHKPWDQPKQQIC